MNQTQSFELRLPQGVGWVDLPCAAPGEGLAQARALAPALSVLQALQQWLNTELPCPEPLPHRVAEAFHLQLPFEAASSLAGGKLVLPWSAVPAARRAPTGLICQWPQVQAHVRLQNLPVHRIVAVELRPGAVLLLPAAFSERWAVHLRPAVGTGVQNGMSPPAHWLAPAQWLPHEGLLQFRGASPPLPGPTADDTWSVWLHEPVRADLRAWLGHGGDTGAEPCQARAGQAELRCAGAVAARGRLLPVGAGWGLRLDHVEALNSVVESAWT